MLRASVLVVMLMLVGPALGEEPPPDPSAGDTYDGRQHHRTWRDNLVVGPSYLLRPIEWVAKLIGWPVRQLINWDERNRVHDTVLEGFSSRDGKLGVRPSFQYSLGYRAIVGVRFFDYKLMGPGSDFGITALTGGADIVYVEVDGRPTRTDQALSVTFKAIYNRRDDQVFTAIGYADDISTGSTRPARYAIDAVDGVGVTTLTAAPGVFLTGTAGLGFRRFADGVHVAPDPPISDLYCLKSVSGLCIPGSVDPVQVPGFDTGTQFVRLGADVRFDTRDNWFRPASGAVLDLGAEWSHGLGFDQSQYVHTRGSLMGVLDLWQRSRTLVVKISAELLEPLGSYPVPFSELVVLGGPDSFRGFRPGLFRNYSSLLMALEYRWPIWMWMDASIFTEYGGVFGRGFEGFSLSRMRPDVGGGVRVRSSSDFYLRAQAAYGWGDGLQFLLSFNGGL